jgi:hypothetical protein
LQDRREKPVHLGRYLSNVQPAPAGREGQLKVLAVASTGASGQIAQSTRRLTLALGTATKRR